MRNKWLLLIGMLILCMLHTGCGFDNRRNLITDREILKIAEYAKEIGKEDLLKCYELLTERDVAVVGQKYKEQRGNIYIRCSSGDFLEDEALEDYLSSFFEKYEKVMCISQREKDEIRVELVGHESYIIVTQKEEPTTLLYGLGVKGEISRTEGGITWISDHRQDTTTSKRYMYYEGRVQKLGDNIWVGKRLIKYPWYSRFME